MKVKTVTSYYGRMRGLLGTRRHHINFDALHLTPCKGIHTFGMKYSLDLAFIDAKGKVLKLVKNVPPQRMCQSPKGTESVMERPSSLKPWLEVGDSVFCVAESEDEVMIADAGQ